MKKWLHLYRFELLLFVLLMVIFNKIFFFSGPIYSNYVWPLNMILLGFVSIGFSYESKRHFNWTKNILFLGVILVPIFTKIIFQSEIRTFFALSVYMLFYCIIFSEVMKQIVKKSEVTESIILGSLSGFLLLIIISTFSFLMIDFIDLDSFNNLIGSSIPQKYHQITYFSSITLTTIGYGDITPKTDNARLLAAFWGVVGQFYMVAVVGIIISKFTSK